MRHLEILCVKWCKNAALEEHWEGDHFGTNSRLLTEKSTLSTSKYQKDILTDDKNYQGSQHIKGFFGI